MNPKKNTNNINIFDFDIYSRRIIFFYNTSEKIGSLFGFVLTILYVVSTIILICIYTIRTIKRSDVTVHDSTMLSQNIPSINISPNSLYFAFGLENSTSLTRFIDETIYKPTIYFIYKEKENDKLVNREKTIIKTERCNVTKFGEKYQNLFVENELNNSYCLDDYNLTLMGGFTYDKFSYIRVEVKPCKNSTENNFHCKPQNIIDSYLTSAYFSMLIKDIGLNPLNYSTPIIPVLQNIFTTVDKSIMRDLLIYFGITEIQTNTGLLTNNIHIDSYLQFRQYNDPFVFQNEENYYSGKNFFTINIRLDQYIKVQQRNYKKLSEVFSIIGGYMQLIYTIFTIMTLITKNINMEKKLLNSLFNFNISQKRIILSIHYEKKLKYLIHYDKGEFNSFIPFIAKKSLVPQRRYYKMPNINQNSKKIDMLVLNKNNSFVPLIQKSVTGIMKTKSNLNKKNNFSDREIYHANSKLSKHHKNSIIINNGNEENINRSKIGMLVVGESDSQNNRIFLKKFKRSTKNDKVDKKDSNEVKCMYEKGEPYSNIDFNIFDYYCNFRKNKGKKNEIQLFNNGVNFYRNQMDILHFFNIFFLTEIMLNRKSSKRANILNQTIEIPI